MGRHRQQPKILNKDIRKLVENHIYIVESVVRKVAPNLPSSVAREEIVSEGVMGLIEAAQKFDSRRGVRFDKWAEIRVRGAIIDYLRKNDILSRPSRVMMKRIAEAIRELRNKLGREPKDEEVADFLGISLEDYMQELQKISALATVSLDEVIFEPVSKEGRRLYEIISDEALEDPFKFSEISNLRNIIENALAKLDDKEREVIKMYYFHGFHMKEISKRLNVSESRISQIHSSAIMKLRAELEESLAKV